VPGLADATKLLARVHPVLEHLPDDQAASTLFALAGSYARRGEWPMARETFLLLVDRYPAHPRTLDACRWLVRHGSSSEARRRHELGQFIAQTEAIYESRPPKQEEGVKQAGHKLLPSGALEVPSKDPKERAASHMPRALRGQILAQLTDPEQARAWYRASLDLGKRLAAFGPLFASDASMQFCLAAARRHLGEFKEAQEYYASFKTAHADGPWREVAAAELWIASPQGQPPRPVAVCRKTPTRPYLDGKFEDECWKGLQPLTLRNASEETAKEYPTQAWFAYDQDFLYVALRCKHPAGQQVSPVKPRPRDADLRPFDRVSILLDLDRDYATCFHLQVDQRGCLYEDCWGDRTWNPQWFVAAHAEADGWQVEAAIPLRQLTGEPVTAGTVWACNVARVLPGRGVQGWSLPAAVEPRPEGLGLLVFQQHQPPPRSMPRVP
jgi:tetratricopeptide (TPR) repeat protein